jgi:hypothetical protein
MVGRVRMAHKDQRMDYTGQNSLVVLLTFQIFGAAFEQAVDVTGGAEGIAGKDDVYVVKVFEF